MGLIPNVARLVLKEHARRTITGDFLMIARQTTFLDQRDAERLLAGEGTPLRPGRLIEYDRATRSATESGKKDFLTDKSFISFFSNAKVVALDVSDYEGADVVCNLNMPLPDSLSEITDFIYNGSCLDNIFNPAQAIVNLSKMLRPNGRIVHLEHGTHVNCPYLTFNPAWFLDYYMLNRFSRCQIYIAYFTTVMGPWSVYEWLPCVHAADGLMYDYSFQPPMSNDFMIVVIAEKSGLSTYDRIPNQAQYRDVNEQSLIHDNVMKGHSLAAHEAAKAWSKPTFLRKLTRFLARQHWKTCNIAVKAGLWPHFRFIEQMAN